MDPALTLLQSNFHILTSANKRGSYAAIPVSWVTQCSFDPPLILAALKTGSLAEQLVGESKCFAIHLWSKDKLSQAIRLFSRTERVASRINGIPFEHGPSGAPILSDALAVLECKLDTTLIRGDHSLVIGKLVRTAAHGTISKSEILQLSEISEMYHP